MPAKALDPRVRGDDTGRGRFFRLQNAAAKQALRVAAGSSSVLRSSFSAPPLCFMRGSEGLAPFMIADAWRRLSDLSAAEPMSAKRELGAQGSPGHEPGTEDLEEKTGRSIRCPARIRPLRQARSGVEPMDKRTGANPSCLRVSHDPCLRDSSLPFRPSEADAAAFRRAP
jgi:hypothetical protein